MKKGDNATVEVDLTKRRPVMSNHTFTHVLNFALRKVLTSNPQLDQKGSLVDEEKLRFDFSHNKGLTAEEIQEIEVCFF